MPAQSWVVKQLEKKIYDLNNEFKYDSSLSTLRNFLNSTSISNNDKYYGYLYLSYTYKRLFDYNTTLQYLDSAMYYGMQTTNKDFYTANINCQKAMALFDIHRYNEAGSLMQLLAKNNYRWLNDEDQAKIFMQEAYLMYLGKNYSSAEKRYDTSIAKMEISSRCDLPMIYGKKIELYGAMGNEKLLKEVYQNSISISDSCNIIKYSLYTNEMMAKALRDKGKYKQAFYYYSLFDSLSRLYNERENLNKLLALDKKYQTENIRQQVALQQKTIESKNKSIGFLAASIIVLILITLLVQLWQRQKKLQREKSFSINYTRQVLEKTEEERKRIAGELHDSISHELLDLKSSLNENSEVVKEKIDLVINNIRIISRNLHPVLFERLGLKTCIENMAERVQQQNGFLLTTDIQYNRSLSSSTELQVYRILQETVTNVVKHADAIAGKIDLYEEQDSVLIKVKDNGKGFNVKECLSNGNAFGLHNIIERSRVIGGQAKIHSNSKGTEILITIPTNKK